MGYSFVRKRSRTVVRIRSMRPFGVRGLVPAFPLRRSRFPSFVSPPHQTPQRCLTGKNNRTAEGGKWLRHGGKRGQGPALQIGGFAAFVIALPRDGEDGPFNRDPLGIAFERWRKRKALPQRVAVKQPNVQFSSTRGKTSPSTSLSAGNGTNDQEGLGSLGDRSGEQLIRRVVRPIRLAGKEP